jgi:hypothetical protein
MKTATLIYRTPIYGGYEQVKLTKRHENKNVLKLFLAYQKSLLPSDAVVTNEIIK